MHAKRVIFVLLLMFSGAAYAAEPSFIANVTRVQDGDTLTVDVPGCYPVVLCPLHIRVFGIDTPESLRGTHGAKCTKELKLGLIAKAWAKAKLTGMTITIQPIDKKLQTDPYGRLLASVTLPSGKDYAAEAIRTGNARPFLRAADGSLVKSNWCE